MACRRTFCPSRKRMRGGRHGAVDADRVGGAVFNRPYGWRRAANIFTGYGWKRLGGAGGSWLGLRGEPGPQSSGGGARGTGVQQQLPLNRLVHV